MDVSIAYIRIRTCCRTLPVWFLLLKSVLFVQMTWRKKSFALTLPQFLQGLKFF